MKIDFDALEKLAASGASATVLIAYLRLQDEKRAPRRARDRRRKAGGKQVETSRKRGELRGNAGGNEATLEDTPRARLFREGVPALIALGKSDDMARRLLGSWLKTTHDDDQLVLATVLRARDLAVADAAGWVIATLKGKMHGNGTGYYRRGAHEAALELLSRSEARDCATGFDHAGAVVIDGDKVG